MADSLTKHHWDKGKNFGGRVLINTIKCIDCGERLTPNRWSYDARTRDRETCSGPRGA